VQIETHEERVHARDARVARDARCARHSTRVSRRENDRRAQKRSFAFTQMKRACVTICAVMHRAFSKKCWRADHIKD
jgi:hypothetical protein